MSGAVSRQIFTYIAYNGDFLQIGIHLLIARYRQQFAALQIRIRIFGQYLQRIRQQRDAAHNRGLFTGFANPLRAVLVRRDMFRPQVFRIGKCKSRLGAETPDVANTLQTLVRHPFGHQQIQLRFGQRYLDIGLVYLHFVIPERIFLDPFVAYGVQDKVCLLYTSDAADE